MSQNIEEQKDFSVQETSTLTASGSESRVILKRTRQEINENEKLKLFKAVNLGLSVACAARVV